MPPSHVIESLRRFHNPANWLRVAAQYKVIGSSKYAIEVILDLLKCKAVQRFRRSLLLIKTPLLLSEHIPSVLAGDKDLKVLDSAARILEGYYSDLEGAANPGSKEPDNATNQNPITCPEPAKPSQGESASLPPPTAPAAETTVANKGKGTSDPVTVNKCLQDKYHEAVEVVKTLRLQQQEAKEMMQAVLSQKQEAERKMEITLSQKQEAESKTEAVL